MRRDKTDGRWKGKIKVKCGACSSSENFDVTIQPGQLQATIEYKCPLCDAVTTCTIRRQEMTDVEVKE